MIAELFWPKEMKELVKKYREEGTLNEEAVGNINKRIRKIIFKNLFLLSLLTLIISTAPSDYEEYWPYAFAGMLVFSIFATCYEVKVFFGRYIIPINLGAKAEGNILSIAKRDVSFVKVGWDIAYKYNYNNNEYSEKICTQSIDDCSSDYSDNDTVIIFVDKNNPKNNIPAFKELTCKFKLQKEEIIMATEEEPKRKKPLTAAGIVGIILLFSTVVGGFFVILKNNFDLPKSSFDIFVIIFGAFLYLYIKNRMEK